MESEDSLPALSCHTPMTRKTRRSASAPVVSAHHYPDFSSDTNRVEAKFVHFGDHIALYSENEDPHGFVSTLG